MRQLEIKQICKTFKTRGIEVSALKDINLSINQGDFFALIGLNGAGKTTLMRILSGVLSADSGEVKICDRTYKEDEVGIKRKIGVVMGGEHSLYGKLTALENLQFFASFYDISKKIFDTRVLELLKLLELTDKKDLLIETYSKGMKQKLLIAKALLHDPDILILDEPCNGIDIVTNFEIKKLLKQLNKEYKKTIILTTHNLHDAEDLCDKLCILQAGKIVANGTFEDVYQSYFKNIIINVSLSNPLTEEEQESMLGEDNIIDIINNSDDGKYIYDLIFDAACNDINLSMVLKYLNVNNLLSINEKKVSLEFLLQYLVEENNGHS